MNGLAICIALFVPWLLFCTMMWARTFHLRYINPWLILVFNLFGLAFVVAIGVFTRNSFKRRLHGDTSREPNWYVFLFLSCLAAWAVGCVCGDREFYQSTEPYYDITNLFTYHEVEPGWKRGLQLLDAGKIWFVNTSRLAIPLSMGFKSTEMYCVAPVVNGNKPPHLGTYDFWAVGKNCCSGNAADFHCGAFNSPTAHAGLRLTRDEDRAFYRAAVQQAEAAYSIKANHPLFFHWTEDPDKMIDKRYSDGMTHFLFWIISHFIFQFFATLMATIGFSKLVHGLN